MPLVAHLHTRFSSWFSRPMRLGLKHADAVLAVSEFAARTAREAGVRPERLSVVPNAIDAAAAPPSSPSRDEVRASLGVPAGAPLVVTVARIVPQKGLDRLVGAFDIARKTAGEARLAVVGAEQPTDPDSLEFNASVRADIARRGLEGSIHFLGHRSDVAAILGAADVFAIASRDEAFGLVYLEAMMAGLPVVAEKSGGTPEVVVDGETGLLAPPDDVEAMGRGLAKLLGDAELSAKMGRAGKERAQRQFSVERTGELARDALERAVRDGPRWGLR
jgi:L-malate glycosyltransferase